VFRAFPDDEAILSHDLASGRQAPQAHRAQTLGRLDNFLGHALIPEASTDRCRFGQNGQDLVPGVGDEPAAQARVGLAAL
jgi:hypothetical protein